MFNVRPQTLEKILLATVVGCILIGLYDLYIANDIGAVLSFTLAGFNAYRYYKIKQMTAVSKTWRSYK